MMAIMHLPYTTNCICLQLIFIALIARQLKCEWLRLHNDVLQSK